MVDRWVVSLVIKSSPELRLLSKKFFFIAQFDTNDAEECDKESKPIH
jgi:hypothetical protein